MMLGDQLSMALGRKNIAWRVGNEDDASSMADVALGPGLFRLLMTFVTLILENSWGFPNSELNPAPLSAHNTLLGRRPITLSSPPKFRDALDLITVSLYGRVLCTLPLAAGRKDMEEYTHTLTQIDGRKPKNFEKSYERLKFDVRKQLVLFANTKVAARLQKERETADKSGNHTNPTTSSATLPSSPPSPAGDMVFESGVLFFDLALRLRNLVEAIRSGNSERIVVILKTIILAFRGTRHTKYAYETVVFLHNYLHVWPVPLRNAIMKAWLVNITGKPDSFKPADLMQEHLNLQIKEIYKAHGSNRSWEWLAMIAPVVHLLRRVAHEFHTSLGDRQGTKHSAVSIKDDIRALIENLKAHRVYEKHPGRKFDPDDSPPKNVITEGHQRLAHGSNRTIDHYNKYFKDLQRRLRVSPVSKMATQPTSAPDASSSHLPPPPLDVGYAGRPDQSAGQEGKAHDSETEDPELAGEEDEDNICALFDWDEIDEGIIDAEFSEHEGDLDDELESDDE
ncbi:hypothetical protein FRC07_006041 [Ceratobasidium sp. 392]|nr:hypothetical protein FRC07_006041 [Ceratobasidium sp. 392]